MQSTTSSLLGFVSMPGGTEWLIILFVALLLFGRRLPEVARGMGRSITEFRKGLTDAQKGIEEGFRESEQADSSADSRADSPSRSGTDNR